MRLLRIKRTKARSMTLSMSHLNPDMLLPILCIGAGLIIPFLTLAELLLARYHG